MNSALSSRHPPITTASSHSWWLFALLAISMAATRYHHFSDFLHIADTSWAVFFLAGLWLTPRWALPALLLLALGIDLASVAIDGAAMSACFTPAYPGLILAYGALWLAGRGAARGDHVAPALSVMLTRMGWAATGVLAAFALSNLTFWAFSGHFGDLGLMTYAERVMPYLGRYVQLTLGYVLFALIIAQGIATAEAWRDASRHNASSAG